MTLADLALEHDVIERFGMDFAVELLDVIDGDALLRPELLTVVETAAEVIEHEFGAEAQATAQLRAVLQHGLSGLQA